MAFRIMRFSFFDISLYRGKQIA